MLGQLECHDADGVNYCTLDVIRVEGNNDIMEIGGDRLYERPEYMVFVDGDGRRFGCMTYDEFHNGRDGVHAGANSSDYDSWEDFEERVADDVYRRLYGEDVEDTLAVFRDGLVPWYE